MNLITKETGTNTTYLSGSSFDYKCRNCQKHTIQHIDICGKRRADINQRKPIGCGVPVSLVSISPPTNLDARIDSSKIDSRLKKFTITTKISSLYPGNDILSRKCKKKNVK